MPVAKGGKTRAAMSQAEKLALENEQMERRLKQLKTAMKKKKEQRPNPGVIWRSGGKGAITQHVVNMLDKNTLKRPRNTTGRKVKILGPKNSGAGQATSASPSSLRKPARKTGRKDLDLLPGPSDSSSDELQNLPGAGMTTEEIGGADGVYDETASHASFLHALNEWRSGGNAPEATHAGESARPGRSATVGDESALAGGSLWDGPAYDERANAQAFQAAVQKWRDGGSASGVAEPAVKSWSNPADDTAQEPSTSSGGCQADLSPSKKPIDIKFSNTSGLSYMEKLMLRRARKNPPSRPVSALKAQALEVIASAPEPEPEIILPSESPAPERASVVVVESMSSGEDTTSIDEETLPFAVEEPADDSDAHAPAPAHAPPAVRRKQPMTNGWSQITVAPEYSSDGMTPSPGLNEAKAGSMENLCAASRLVNITNITPSAIDSEDVSIKKPSGIMGHLVISATDIPSKGGEDTKLNGAPRQEEKMNRASLITPSMMDDFEVLEKSFTE